MNLNLTIQDYLQPMKRLLFFLLLFSTCQVNSQAIDSIFMSIEPFSGDDNVTPEFTRIQVAKILSSQVTDYIIPVLNIKDHSRVIKLRSQYKATIKDTSELSAQYPDYICEGIITKNFITANITKSNNEEVFLSINIERKKNGQHIKKDVKKLGDELVEKLIEKIYTISLGHRGRVVLRTNSNDNLEIRQSGNLVREDENEIELSEGARVLNLQIDGSNTSSIEKSVELKPKAFQFMSIKKKKQGIKIKRLKTKAELATMLFLSDNNLGQLYEFRIKREIGDKFSLGVSWGTGILSYEHSLPTFNDLEPIITKESKAFSSLNLLLDYEHFFSKSDIIVSAELGASFSLKGGHFLTAISWVNLHWLSFELGLRNYAIDIDRYQFKPFQSEAEKITQAERFTFLTLGIRLKHNF